VGRYRKKEREKTTRHVIGRYAEPSRGFLFSVRKRNCTHVFKNLLFFIFFNRFDMLILKIIFLKKYYFDVFGTKKHFKKQPQPHSQISK